MPNISEMLEAMRLQMEEEIRAEIANEGGDSDANDSKALSGAPEGYEHMVLTVPVSLDVDELYERYQLAWMLEHGESLANYRAALVEQLLELLSDNFPHIGDSLEEKMTEAHAAFVFDSGFNGSIFACKDEWLDAEWSEAPSAGKSNDHANNEMVRKMQDIVNAQAEDNENDDEPEDDQVDVQTETASEAPAKEPESDEDSGPSIEDVVNNASDDEPSEHGDDEETSAKTEQDGQEPAEQESTETGTSEADKDAENNVPVEGDNQDPDDADGNEDSPDDHENVETPADSTTNDEPPAPPAPPKAPKDDSDTEAKDVSPDDEVETQQPPRPANEKLQESTNKFISKIANSAVPDVQPKSVEEDADFVKSLVNKPRKELADNSASWSRDRRFAWGDSEDADESNLDDDVWSPLDKNKDENGDDDGDGNEDGEF